MSDRESNHHSVKRKYFKNDTLEDANFNSNRDISPYRVENFIEMLHQFGISDTEIKKKLITSPKVHSNFINQELSNDSLKDGSRIIRNVRKFINNKNIEKSKTANNKIIR